MQARLSVLFFTITLPIGIDIKNHDIRFVEDDWESPTLGAAGLGWEVWCDGMEITQFTYFQQMAGFDCKPVSVEITYGLERISMFTQQKKNASFVRKLFPPSGNYYVMSDRIRVTVPILVHCASIQASPKTLSNSIVKQSIE